VRHVSLPVFAPIGVCTVPNVALGASAHATWTSLLKIGVARAESSRCLSRASALLPRAAIEQMVT